ncbi:hypothetical protein D9M71_339550 [compost metagenome]
MVDLDQGPGVLVEVHVARSVDVPLARLDGAYHFPHTVQFVAGQVLVDMTGLDHVRVLQLRRPQLVVVVGNVDFLLADQLPVVAVWRAVVHVVVVCHAHAVGGGTRAIVGDLRGAAYAALAGVIGPRQARFLDLVDGLVGQDHVAGQTRRTNHRLGDVQEEVRALLRRNVGHRLRITDLLLDLDDGEIAVGHRSGLGDDLPDVGAAVAGLVVPHHFHAVLRNREGEGTRLLEVLQAVAVVDQLDIQRAGLRRIVDRLRCRRGAAGLVHRNPVGFRIALEHRLLAGGQLVLVLVDVVPGDDEQRLVVGERIAEEAFGVHRYVARLQAAGPGRNAAVGVAGLLGPQRGQGSTKFCGFFRGNRGHCATGHQRECQGAGFEQTAEFQLHVLFQLRSFRG